MIFDSQICPANMCKLLHLIASVSTSFNSNCERERSPRSDRGGVSGELLQGLQDARVQRTVRGDRTRRLARDGVVERTALRVRHL